MIVCLSRLEGVIFCGHLVADLDSIASAIGAAELYGGSPARASEINSETEFAMEHWGIQMHRIPPIEDILTKKGDTAPICLVDFQQRTQLHQAINESQIVGIIDHHALQSATIVTQKPIHVDIRPWGSASSIIAHSFVSLGKPLPKDVAGLLLCAILSDTLNLRSPTSTEWDRKLVSMLVQYCGIHDVNKLCARQFKAKSKNLTFLSPYSLVSGDIKQFRLSDSHDIKCAFSVIETTDSPSMVSRHEDFLAEMQCIRSELDVSLIFLAIVDIVGLQSHLIVAGPKERSLAIATGWLGQETDETLTIVALPNGQVSRKADFIPALSRAVADGWTPPRMGAAKVPLKETTVVVETDETYPGGKFVRRLSASLTREQLASLQVATAPAPANA